MGEGLWCEIAGRDFAHRPALFLDRDGVLVEDAHYLGRAEDVRTLEGARRTAKKQQGWPRCDPAVLGSGRTG
jgi:D-glycero-D-manno-heptose 1,7-bisphosphate phosphatase